MTQVIADQKEIEFILYEQFNAEKLLRYEKYKGFSKKIFDMILSEARKIAVKEILPTLVDGDKQGVQFENGKITVPDSFHRARKVLREADLTSTMEDPDWGGQGLPFLISRAIMEYTAGANYALCGYIHLSHGTGKMIELFGTEQLKNMFLENLYTAKWSGTMLLTEPEAGSDLSAITTTAKKNDDGTYSITGNKIFITAGEHDMTENIIHPVLARIEGAPKGSRGISIFIVPKIWVNEDKSLAEPNDVQCLGVEEKMGFHGSATCSMALGSKEKCRGFLLGEENKGLQIMFHMMNATRLIVGFQGSTTASLAYLYALDYARQRIQGKDLASMKDPEAASVPIIRHPDVRRMLTWMKAHVDGMRSMIYYTTLCFDQKENAENKEQKEHASDLIELLTPVVKAYCAQRGFEVCVQAVQVFGGYGYTKAFPVEQLVRDVKLASIFEGTDGIQAMDFLGRKLGMKKGMVFKGLLDEMSKTIADAKKIESLISMAESLGKAVETLGITAFGLGDAAMSEKYATAFANAHPFLEATGDVVMGWMHLWRSLTAVKALGKKSGKKDQIFYGGIVTSARFYMETVLPVTQGRMASVQALSNAALSMDEASFE
ncbi:MAG: acyl-CoA dehydrogenase [Desulfobacteraceae bacterium]|nr:acyl-CoA dehydrogenase [Desulfobacteraceae bacterium]